MIVVSDTSPLAYLFSIGVVESLSELFGGVLIPESVARELRHPQCAAAEWIAAPPPWLTIGTPMRIPNLPELDIGERDAIALALEVGAERLLIDERAGRLAAQQLGFKVAGTLAVILDGAEHGLFDGLTALDRLSETNFYASAELLNSVRQLLTK